MSVRTRLGRGLEATLGKERTDKVRRAERHYRRQLADRLAPPPPPKPAKRRRPAAKATPAAPVAKPRPLGEPNDRQGGWIASDPFVPHPTPVLSRHDLLRGLHEHLQPRTYFEIGVNEGSSLTLSRTRSVAVDPEFVVSKPLHCDLDLVQAKSDEFFTRPDALAHFEGTPIDLAFIDGMHLSEFALRDFMNVERHLSPTGVTVLDDVLPRNGLEAARRRVTGAWAGDVYKAVEIIARHRPDLLVIMVNTGPTGTAVVIGADPASEVLPSAYDSEVPYLEADDPQTPPQAYMARTIAVDPADLLASEAWPLIVQARETGDAAAFEKAREILRAIPTLG
ncbi:MULTISPECIES: class I SAM-dependent methyltransferase [unclassified Nocardioides]|uniref:class I SAM-dependent methyltransferase n=1 Tax=unclassified Nocardioides TaxID=2615069 RepID=UPI0030142FE2